MRTCRVHVTGASGAGVTTLGRALASALACPHHDTDDYFWLPTTPPYAQKRPRQDRLRLMAEMFLDRPGWVLSGSLDGWGDPIVPHFDMVVFVRTPTEMRLRRLRKREARRYGRDAVAPGGWRHADVEALVAWAAGYDEGRDLEQRCLARHRGWLAALSCRVIELDGARPTQNLTEGVLALFDA